MDHPRTPAQLRVLFLPGEDFALVLSDVQAPELEQAKQGLDSFAAECGAKATLVSQFPIATS